MINTNLQNLSVLKNILHDATFASYAKYEESKREQDLYRFVGNLIDAGYEDKFLSYIERLILSDENAVALQLSNGQTPTDYAKAAFIRDLQTITDSVTLSDTHGLYGKGAPTYPFDGQFDARATYFNLTSFYKQQGYGKFIFNRAFTFTDNELIPESHASEIRLTDLKNYSQEKATLINNVENFLNGLPYEHMLLYGDRGTGKSSTVHALLNEYAENRLRLIEISKENLIDLPKIRKAIANYPMKFLLFIDDLSLTEDDKNTYFLKTALEGSVSSETHNTMIAATSNRRHIVKENFYERQTAVHARDSIEEQLSLSDRFGITVMFSTTDKEQYLSIVKQLAQEKNLAIGENELCTLAERWAILKGGRSPRRAKQFTDIVYACLKSGNPVTF